jgi:glycosyltransferase involved in cell wall biosynthesis
VNILMIDRSSITDRRIVLEATALQPFGHVVNLIASSANTNAWPEIESFKVRRFVDHAFGDSTQILKWRDRLEPFLGKRIGLLCSVFLKPELGFKFVSGANSLSRSRIFAMQSVLGLMSNQLGFREAWRLLKLAWLARDPERFVPDSWEQAVIAATRDESYDVIHVHDLPTLSLGVFLKKQKGAKLVYDAHELYCYLPGMSPEAQSNLKRVEGKLIRHADLVVLINDQQAARMHEDYGDFPYVCLTNATTPDGVTATRSTQIRDRLKIPNSEKILIFQGYVSRARNIDALIEGVALSKTRPHVVFLSWGPEIEDLKSLAKERGIADRVHFLPPVPWDQVISWAEAADVGIMPYQPTNLNTIISSPNKMYEFIMARTPMIGSSELVNVKATIDDNGFGLARRLREPQDYASAIDEILDPSKDRWTKARAALDLKWRDFTWESASKPFIESYRRMELAT